LAWRGIKGIPWKGRAYLRKKYPGAFPLSESQIEILEGLARKAPTNAYMVAKTTEKAYSFVFNTLKELKRRKIVVFKGKKTTEKGTTANIYDLALDGVLLVLQREMRFADVDEWNREFIRGTIEKYSSLLPLVFGKWKYFEKVGLGKIILTRLKITVDTHESNPFKKGTGFYPWLDEEQQITRFFFLFDFDRLHNHFIPNFDAKAWITALKQDEELKAYITQELRQDQKRLKNMQINREKVVLFMESLSEKEKSL
jgi:hypothetical protein